MTKKKEILFCDYFENWIETYKVGACAYIQKLLQDINTTGTLDGTIANLEKLSRSFDAMAIEYGPYKKDAYLRAVTQPLTQDRESHA